MKVQQRNLWIIGEIPNNKNQWLTNTDKNLASIMRALIQTSGHLYSGFIEDTKHYGKELLTLKISLPLNKAYEFQNLIDFPITEAEDIFLGI